MKETETDQSYLNDWLDQFYQDYQVTENQRDQADEELRFAVVPGGQWEGWLQDEYDHRAKMEFDKCSAYAWNTHQIWVDHRYSVDYTPLDNDTDDAKAELLDGLFRRDIARGGQVSIDTAVHGAIFCGTGAVILNTEWDDETDPEDEKQNIVFSEKPNSYSSVIFDRSARRADKADARYCHEILTMSRDDFKESWPDVDGSVMINDRSVFNWTQNDVVHVIKRYEIVKKSKTYYSFGHPETNNIVRVESKNLEEEGKELKQFGYFQLKNKAKTIKVNEVHCSKFVNGHVLEEPRRIAGEYIPVVPFYGYRTFVDGQEFYHGVIRKKMDPQRLLNMSMSLAAESAAHSSEDKLIFAPEQINNPNISAEWGGNRHQKPFLVADKIKGQGNQPDHYGPVGQVPGTTLSPSVQSLIQVTSQYLTDTTGGAPQETIDPNMSGKALNALYKQNDRETRPIFDNVMQSIKHIGRVYASIAKEIYGGDENIGRQLRIVSKKGETTPVVLKKQTGYGGSFIHENDLSTGKFEVNVDVGPSHESQREESITYLKDILLALPDGHPLRENVLYELIGKLPASGIDDLKDQARRNLIMNGGAKPANPEEEEMLAQMQQAQGQPDPNQMLIEATAKEQETQAMKNAAEIKKIEAQMQLYMAQAAKYAAEAESTEVETQEQIMGIKEQEGLEASQI